jgi:hypothetical protein
MLLAGIVIDKAITKMSLEQSGVDGPRFHNYSEVVTFHEPQLVTDLQRAVIKQYQDPLCNGRSGPLTKKVGYTVMFILLMVNGKAILGPHYLSSLP